MNSPPPADPQTPERSMVLAKLGVAAIFVAALLGAILYLAVERIGDKRGNDEKLFVDWTRGETVHRFRGTDGQTSPTFTVSDEWGFCVVGVSPRLIILTNDNPAGQSYVWERPFSEKGEYVAEGGTYSFDVFCSIQPQDKSWEITVFQVKGP